MRKKSLLNANNSTESPPELKSIFNKDRIAHERKRRSEPRISLFKNLSTDRKDKREMTMHPNMVVMKSKFANDSLHTIKQNHIKSKDASPNKK